MDLGNRLDAIETHLYHVDKDLDATEALLDATIRLDRFRAEIREDDERRIDNWLIFLGTLTVLSTTLAVTSIAIIYSKGLM